MGFTLSKKPVQCTINCRRRFRNLRPSARWREFDRSKNDTVSEIEIVTRNDEQGILFAGGVEGPMLSRNAPTFFDNSLFVSSTNILSTQSIGNFVLGTIAPTNALYGEDVKDVVCTLLDFWCNKRISDAGLERSAGRLDNKSIGVRSALKEWLGPYATRNHSSSHHTDHNTCETRQPLTRIPRDQKPKQNQPANSKLCSRDVPSSENPRLAKEWQRNGFAMGTRWDLTWYPFLIHFWSVDKRCWPVSIVNATTCFSNLLNLLLNMLNYNGFAMGGPVAIPTRAVFDYWYLKIVYFGASNRFRGWLVMLNESTMQKSS